MSLVAKFQADLKEAMRARDALRTSTLRMLLADVQHELKRAAGVQVDDAAAVTLLRRAIKARKEAAEQFRLGKREDLATREEAEQVVLESYLPAVLDEAATRRLVEQAVAELGVTGRRELGKVMGKILAAHRAEVDAALVRRLAEEVLG